MQNQRGSSKSTLLIFIWSGLVAAGLLLSSCNAQMETSQAVEALNSLESDGALDHDDHSGGAPHLSAKSASFVVGQVLTFEVHADLIGPNAVYNWSHTFWGNSTCANVVNPLVTEYSLRCMQAGQLEVSLTIDDEGQTFGPYQMTVQVTTTAQPPPPANLVTFSIAAGTADGPWNSAANTVEVFVGQTLRIYNNDNTAGAAAKRLHTSGKPCGHFANDIPFGGYGDCVISTAYNATTDGVIYNHNVGTAARFYLRAYDGAALYLNNCASCHGPLPTSEYRGATANEITMAIANIGPMRTPALRALTPKEIEAIAFVLK